MRKIFWIAALSSICNFHVFSQSEAQKTDSLKIDSLKKILSSLNGTDRIDCMILLCQYYADAKYSYKVNSTDSIFYYRKKISDESKAIGYKKGIALGLLISPPDSTKEKNIKDAVKIGEQIEDDEVLGYGYAMLTQITKEFAQSETYYIKAIDHYHKAGKRVNEAAWCNWLSQSYMAFGKNEKAFDYAKRSRDIIRSVHSSEFANAYSWASIWSLWNLSRLYSIAGDQESALNYMKMANQIEKDNNPKSIWGGFTLDISTIFAEIGQYDSALIYWNRMRNEPSWDYTGWRPGKKLAYNYLANIYVGTKQFDKAIEILKDNNIYFDSLIKYASGNYRNAGNYGRMVASFSLARAYDSTKNFKTALKYAKEGFNLARQNDRSPEMMEGYQILSSVYHHLNNNDSAYSYLVKYNTIKDSVQNKQFLLRIYNSKKEAEEERKTGQINLLNKENQLKVQKLKQQAILRNSLIIGILLLLLLGVFIFRNLLLKRKNDKLRMQKDFEVQRLENEKKQAELHQRAVELEMQALRAQMNPHFIFNCLSSINRFIFKNDNKVASDYLTRFSRLIRMVLMHSQKKLIPLEDELEMIRLYLDLERLRFKDAFDYSITTTNIVDAGNIFIPPLLLQPFCENAVWHGLMHKERKGHLNIVISEVVSEHDKTLHCIIEDDGVGRDKAAEMKSKSAGKEKSLGLKITTERIALLNKENNFNTFYKIDDVLNDEHEVAGTIVQLKIKYKEAVEEVV